MTHGPIFVPTLAQSPAKSYVCGRTHRASPGHPNQPNTLIRSLIMSTPLRDDFEIKDGSVLRLQHTIGVTPQRGNEPLGTGTLVGTVASLLVFLWLQAD